MLQNDSADFVARNGKILKQEGAQIDANEIEVNPTSARSGKIAQWGKSKCDMGKMENV